MRHQKILLPCLVMSGFSGLAYELLWIRLLARSFGSTTLSVSTVLAVFFGGLALGSWLAGRRVHALGRPLRAYGLIEALMAVFGLALHPVLHHLTGFFAVIDPGTGPLGVATRFAVALPLLLGPTVLMGMTLPFACRAMIVDDRDIGRGLGLIYGTNTFGAGLGAFATTYLLLPRLGLSSAMVITVLINAAAAVAALVASARHERTAMPVAGPPTAGAGQGTIAPAFSAVVMAQAFLSGFAFIALEVAWTRIFATVLSGTIYGVGAVLICVLAGIAGGGWISARLGRLIHWIAPTLTVAWTGAILLTSLLTASLPTVAYVVRSLSETSGLLDPIYLQLTAVILLLCSPSLCAGACLPLLVRQITATADATGGVSGRVYAVNTVGSIAGALATGFWLLPDLGSNQTILISMAAMALAAALTLPYTPRGRARVVAYAALAATGLTLAGHSGYEPREMVVASSLDGLSLKGFREATAAKSAATVYLSEGRTSTLSVSLQNLGLGLSLNGLGQGYRSFVEPKGALESVLVAAVPAAHVARPANALVIGLGAAVTVETLLNLGVPSLKVLELEAKVADAVDIIHLGKSPVADPRVSLEVNDARHFLAVSARQGREKYDIIASMPAHPWVAAPLFTREFFALARQNLAEQGVFAAWFGIGWMDQDIIRSLLAAFTTEFGHHMIYCVPEIGALFLVGGNRPLTLDPARLRDLAAHADLKSHVLLESPDFLPLRLLARGDGTRPPIKAPVMNTDDSAYVEVMAPRRKGGGLALDTLIPMFAETGAPRGGAADPTADASFMDAIMRPGPRTKVEILRLKLALLAPDAPAEGSAARRLLAARIACLEGDDARLRTVLDLQTGGAADAELDRRLAKTGALCRVGARAERLAALNALLPDQDAALALAAIDPDALAAGAAAFVNLGRDPDRPIDWLISVFLAGPDQKLTAEEIRTFTQTVLPALRRTDPGLGVLRLAGAVAARNELTQVQTLLQPLEVNQRAVLATRYTAAAKAAEKTQRWADAAGLREEALQISPGDTRALINAYQVFRRADDQAGMERIRLQMLYAGHTQRTADSLVAFAEQALAGKKVSDFDVQKALDDDQGPSTPATTAPRSN